MRKTTLTILLLAQVALAKTNQWVNVPYGGYFPGGTNAIAAFFDTNRFVLPPWWSNSSPWLTNPWVMVGGGSVQSNLSKWPSNSVPSGLYTSNDVQMVMVWQLAQAMDSNSLAFDQRLDATNGVVWVGPGPTNSQTGTVTGLGSYSVPFIGDLDQIVSNAPTFSLIGVLPGTYWTAGNTLQPKTGQRLVGSGIGVTVIRRDTNAVGIPLVSNSIAVIVSGANFVEVANLTADANAAAQATTTNAFQGVTLLGAHEKVHRVSVVNCSGNAAQGQEMFCLYLGGNHQTNFGHNIVTECLVSSVLGNYGGALGAFGEQCYIGYNQVEMPPMVNNGSHFFHCIDAAYGSGSIIEDNVAVGGDTGSYYDSWNTTNLTIANNRFVGQRQGINMDLETTDPTTKQVWGLNILNNVIEVDSRAGPGLGIGLYSTNHLSGVNIVGNLIHYKDDLSYPTNTGQGIVINTNTTLSPPYNIKIAFNTIDTNMTVSVGNTNKVVWIGNTDTKGNVLLNTP